MAGTVTDTQPPSGSPAMFLIAAIWLLIPAVLFLAILIRVIYRDKPEAYAKSLRQRGFEVKPITGKQTRAETKKDDHHG
jgi:hypothetical protein